MPLHDPRKAKPGTLRKIQKAQITSNSGFAQPCPKGAFTARPSNHCQAITAMAARERGASTKPSGLCRKARPISPCKKSAQARVIPQPGQSKPVKRWKKQGGNQAAPRHTPANRSPANAVSTASPAKRRGKFIINYYRLSKRKSKTRPQTPRCPRQKQPSTRFSRSAMLSPPLQSRRADTFRPPSRQKRWPEFPAASNTKSCTRSTAKDNSAAAANSRPEFAVQHPAPTKRHTLAPPPRWQIPALAKWEANRPSRFSRPTCHF